MANVYTFTLDLDWQLVSQLSALDRFDAAWTAVERRQSAGLRHLRSLETVRSAAASTRIEGARLTDEEVELLLRQVEISPFQDRDSQEVRGYHDTLLLILDHHESLDLTVGNIQNLHGRMLAPCDADAWHRGRFKVQSNVVEATLPDGSKRVVFRTTDPGFPTEEAMRALVVWHAADSTTHPLVKCALFAYEFLSIHPFQDGNGRLSRLLTTLLLLKARYSWIQYVSFEHEIESRKADYYRVLHACQSRRPGENVGPWLGFFLEALLHVQQKLDLKLRSLEEGEALGVREQAMLALVGERPGLPSGEIARRLAIPLPTVKRVLARLVERGRLQRHGRGPGTGYSLV